MTRTPRPPPPQAKNNDRPILTAEYINERHGRFYEDRNEKLWFLSEDLTVLEEKDGKISFEKIELNFPSNSATSLGITGFRQARDGSFWIASTQGVMRRLPDGRSIFYKDENTRTDLFTSVLKDNAGRIWLTRSSGIYVFKPETSAELSALGNFTIRNLDALAQIHSEKKISLPEKTAEIFKFTGVEGLAAYQTNSRTSKVIF